MHEKLNEALNEISDHHIAQAAQGRQKKRVWWMGAAAAVLAVAIFIGAVAGPGAIRAEALTLADDPRIMARPDLDDYKDRDAWRADLEVWEAQRDSRLETKREALKAMKPFLTDASVQFLSGNGNRLWSPANAYVGLAALTELTAGNSRQQILNLLGAQDMETLRAQVSAVWESSCSEGKEASKLANSLWLEQGLNCSKETLDALSYHHYASVYRGDLGSDTINRAIGSWLNQNTGGLLKSAADNIRLPENAVLALYSTLYFQSKWVDEFHASNNTKSVFHAPGGDITAEFMNKKLDEMYYYWGDNFGAVSLSLKNGSRMWFFLPDEGCTVDDVLDNGSYMDLVLSGSWENQKYMKVNLSVPKFDVTGTQNLRGGLRL